MNLFRRIKKHKGEQQLRSCCVEDYPGHEEDIENLRKFFKVCVDRKLGLWGW